jgi:hypothetical protein
MNGGARLTLIALPATLRVSRPTLIRRRPTPTLSGLWLLHERRARNPGSCAPQRASHASGATRARQSKRANCLLRFTGGSLKGSTRAI